MDIRNFSKWTTTILATLAFQFAGAAGTGNAPAGKAAEGDTSGASYTAYLVLATQLEQAESNGTHARSVDRVAQQMGMDKTEADTFVNFVLASYDEMKATNHKIANRMLCSGDRPKYEAKNAYAVLNVLDDIKDTNLRKTYRRVKVNFGSDAAAHLDNWLAQIQQSNPERDAQFRKAYLNDDQTVEQVISSACDMLASF